MYAGLMTFWALLVFGLAGSYVTFRADKRTAPKHEAKTVKFETKAGATDREVVDQMRDQLGFVSTRPVPDRVIHRDGAGHLAITLLSPNGWVEVIWLHESAEAVVTEIPFSVGEYLNQMHSASPLVRGAPMRMLWSVYTELSIFTLLFLVLSGIYLWLTSRPKLWWAQASFVAGTGVMIFFFVWVT